MAMDMRGLAHRFHFSSNAARVARAARNEALHCESNAMKL